MAGEAERARMLHEVAPQGWDTRPLTIADMLKEFMRSHVDEGTQSKMDSGFGDGEADFYATLDGVEYVVIVKRTRQGEPSGG